MAADKRKASRHTEIERKFAVTDATVAPSFAGLSSVAGVERLPAQHLDAVYFDTPSQDLAAHRVTLRRRTGVRTRLADRGPRGVGRGGR